MLQKEMSIETYEVVPFNKLVLRDDGGEAAVYIEQGIEESLQVEASPDVLRRIEVGVRDGTLYIRLGGSWLERLADKLTTSLTRPKVIYRLQVKDLLSADLSCASILGVSALKTKNLRLNLCGVTRAVVEHLEADRLQLKHSGAGKLDFKGSVQYQEVHLSGAGFYAATGLCSETADINISGPSRAQVYSTDRLDVTIRGTGSVEYLGEPKVRQQVLGMGGVMRMV